MKYIIKESRLNKAIYDYIDELFDGAYYVYGQNYDKGIEDENILEFINDDYEECAYSDWLPFIIFVLFVLFSFLGKSGERTCPITIL